MSRAKRSEKPDDRLTRICAAMSAAMEEHPEWRKGDKCVIFLDSDVDQVGGLVMFGYEDDTDALASVSCT